MYGFSSTTSKAALSSSDCSGSGSSTTSRMTCWDVSHGTTLISKGDIYLRPVVVA